MKDLFGNQSVEQMKALTWKEPYASLMLPPFNKVETRTLPTNYRGLVLIHSAKQPYKNHELWSIAGSAQYERIQKVIQKSGYRTGRTPSYAIAVGRLTACRLMLPQDEDACFVKYHPGLYVHIYTDVRPIELMPWEGKQGWSDVPPEIIQQIKYLPLEAPERSTQY